MSDNVLILHPEDALYAPSDVAPFVSWLEEEGLVQDGHLGEGDLPPGERRGFRTGRAFEDLVVFRGPASRARSDFIRSVISLVLVGPLDRAWFLASAYTDDPICGVCAAEADWSRIAEEWFQRWEQPGLGDVPEVTCSACGVRAMPWAFDWRGKAAFARLYLEIWHVHAGAAAPSPRLLEGLARITGRPWSFLYYRL